MQRLLQRACHAANLARTRPGALKPALIDRINRDHDRIPAAGLDFQEAQPPPEAPQTCNGRTRRGRPKRRTGHNLLLRLQTRKEDVLRFLIDPSVPCTNNEAERDARMMKLKQKISGGFRSEDSAHDFAVIRSVIATARKQGWKIIDTLMLPPEAMIPQLDVR